jgi:hypothetical protein
MWCDLNIDPSVPSNATFTAALSDCRPFNLRFRSDGQLLDVSIATTAGSTPGFSGLAFAFQPPPRLLSVSGCEGGNGATL